jgi:hypothetical protein
LYICWKLILPELDTASEQNAIIERLNYSVTAIGSILGPEEKPFQYPTFCLNKLPLTIENPSPSDGIYVPDKAIDGSLDPESIWSSFGIGAYITVDIGSIKTVCRVVELIILSYPHLTTEPTLRLYLRAIVVAPQQTLKHIQSLMSTQGT